MQRVKKKVCFVSVLNSFMLQFLLPYLKMFHDKGYEVWVATGEKGEIPFCDKKITIPIHRSPYSLKNLAAIKELKRVFLREKFEIIHCHTPVGSVVTRLAAKEARRNGTRVIYTAHGFHFFKGAPIYFWLFFYPVEKYLSKFTDTLITINLEDYQNAKKHFQKCQDICYVPGVGLNTEKFHKLTKTQIAQKRKELGFAQSDFLMIFPAEISRNKRQKWLISSLASFLHKHPDAHLLFPGVDRLKGACWRYTKKLKLDQQVHFLGYRRDIPDLLAIADLSVPTSRREGLPVNVMEAMYAKLPVVASDCRGHRDLVKNNRGGKIIPIHDKAQFSAAVQDLYNHPAIREKYGEFNSQEIAKYSIDSVKGIYEEIYFRPKKVLHLLSTRKYSGAENVACMIIENVSGDFDSVYCSPDGAIADTLKTRGINYLPLRRLSISEVKRVVKTYNPNIIHTHDIKASLLAALCKKSNQRLICHIHKNDPKLRRLSLKSLLFVIAQKKSTKTIWVSKAALESYYFKRHFRKKNLVLKNVIDIKHIRELAKLYQSEKFDMIFLGRLEPEKNPLRFIELVQAVKIIYPAVRVAIVGTGALGAIIKSAIEKAHLEANIRLFGHLKNPYPVLANSAILCNTSKSEGLPMSFLEARALGKIIVSMLENDQSTTFVGRTGYYNSTNLTKIAQKITIFLEKSQEEQRAIVQKIKTEFEAINDLEFYISVVENTAYNSWGGDGA